MSNVFFVIADGRVENVILVAPGEETPEGLQCVPGCDGVVIGWAYQDGEFSPPLSPPAEFASSPSTVTMRQARLALLAAGKLAAVATAIEGLPNPHKEAAQIEWDYATTVERSSDVMQLLAAALDLDDDALDALFTDAATR